MRNQFLKVVKTAHKRNSNAKMLTLGTMGPEHLNTAEDRISKENDRSEETTQNTAQRPGDRKYTEEANRDGGPRKRRSNICLMRVSKEETS